MIRPATVDLTAQHHAPFVYEIWFDGIDLTGATLDMHVRLLPGTPGAALIDLSPAAAGSQGLSMVHAGGSSTITIQIDETTLEALMTTLALQPGEDADLAYDLAITRSGQPKAVFFRGAFTIEAGVTT